MEDGGSPPLCSLVGAQREHLCGFCQNISCQNLLDGEEPRNPKDASADLVDGIRMVTTQTWVKSGFMGNSVDQLLKRRSSCGLCRLILDNLYSRGLEELLATDRSTTLSRRCVLRLVEVSGRPYEGEDQALAALSIDLERVPLSGERPLFASYGLRLSATGDTHPEVAKRCVSEHIGRVMGHDSFNRLKSWIATCVKEHEVCRRTLSGESVDDRNAQAILPLRVIHIPDQGPLRLLETRSGRDGRRQKGRYVALSYCWGRSNTGATLKLTKGNLDDLKREIKEDCLPKTIRDAITVTRKMGLHLLWVDALCIIQEDNEDWIAEVGAMSQIYQQASFTIAVLGDRDSYSGFLDSSCDNTVPVHLPWNIGNQSSECRHGRCIEISAKYPYSKPKTEKPLQSGLQVELQGSSWYTRAWTFQEQILSRRVLYIGKHQIFWECQSASYSKDGFDQKASVALPGDGFHTEITKASLFEALGKPIGQSLGRKVLSLAKTVIVERRGINRLLTLLTWQYSQRQLSELTDKLPAFEGLVNALKERLFAEDLAGIWFGYTGSHGLFWLPFEQVVRTLPMRAPTWSWASCEGGTRPGNAPDREMDTLVNFSDTQYLHYNPLMTPPARGVKPASLKIEAHLIIASRSSQTCGFLRHTWDQFTDCVQMWPGNPDFSNLRWPRDRCHLLYVKHDTGTTISTTGPMHRVLCPVCGIGIDFGSESVWINHVEDCLSNRNSTLRDNQSPRYRLAGIAHFDNSAEAPESFEMALLNRETMLNSLFAPDIGTAVAQVSSPEVGDYLPKHGAPPQRSSPGLRAKASEAKFRASVLRDVAREKLQSVDVLTTAAPNERNVLPYVRCKKAFRARDLPELNRRRMLLQTMLLVKPLQPESNMYRRIGIAVGFQLSGVGRLGGVDLLSIAPPKREIVLV